MKYSVPVALILCGTLLVALPILHHLLVIDLVASTLVATTAAKDSGSVQLPSFDSIYYDLAVAAGVLQMITGVILTIRGQGKAEG